MFNFKGERDSESFIWEPPDPETLSSCFEDYSVVALISQGCRGAVYRSIQSNLDRTVAIRIVAPVAGGFPALGQRFHDEVRASSVLEHPEIITVHDFGSVEIPNIGKCFFVVTEFVQGKTLTDQIKTGGLDPIVALKVVARLCDVLEYAHGRGCLHGDIRPGNVFVTTSGGVKIGGFGLASVTSMMGSGKSHSGTALEIQDEEDVDHRADIYSLGAMILEMLTGTAPDSNRASSQKTRLDAGLDGIIRKAMEEDPGNRYQHVSEVRTDVEMVAGNLQNRRRKRKRLAAALIFMGLVAIVGASAFYQPEPKPWMPPSRPVKADIRVTTNLDGDAVPGSLREAIANAKTGDVIGFDASLAGQTIRLNSHDGLLLEKSITIDASDLGELLTIDANGSKRVFRMYSKNLDITFVNLNITGGNSQLEGGGIRNKGANLTFVNCAILNNRTTSLHGGGLYNQGGGKIMMENCLIAGNISGQGGAGFCNFGGETAILKNCLITGNECTEKSRHGCAVLNVNWSTLELIHCTVVGNREVGVHSHDASNLTIENSIFADNEGYGYDDIYIRKRDGSGVKTRGVNLVKHLNADVKSGAPPVSADPMLGPLGDYGGWTRTMRPLPGSRAIDAIAKTDLKSDIRRLDRPIDGDGDGIARPDLGAVEFDPDGLDR